MLLAVPAGILFAFAALAVARALGAEQGRVLLLVLLGVTAGIYLGPALADGNLASLVIESLGVVLFCALALVGSRHLRLLGVAWALHAGWDLVHVVGEVRMPLPEWYAWACIVADASIGGFLTIWGLGPAAPRKAPGVSPAPAAEPPRSTPPPA
jgi:hypothetical protein